MDTQLQRLGHLASMGDVDAAMGLLRASRRRQGYATLARLVRAHPNALTTLARSRKLTPDVVGGLFDAGVIFRFARGKHTESTSGALSRSPRNIGKLVAPFEYTLTWGPQEVRRWLFACIRHAGPRPFMQVPGCKDSIRRAVALLGRMERGEAVDIIDVKGATNALLPTYWTHRYMRQHGVPVDYTVAGGEAFMQTLDELEGRYRGAFRAAKMLTLLFELPSNEHTQVARWARGTRDKNPAEKRWQRREALKVMLAQPPAISPGAYENLECLSSMVGLGA